MKTSFALSALRRLRGGKQGFSLVEVTIALGVTAFALVALFGMLPTGLNLFRSSMDTSIKSQIVQELNSEALLADFTDLIELSKTDPQLRYFDDNGKDVTEIGGEVLRFIPRRSRLSFRTPRPFPGTTLLLPETVPLLFACKSTLQETLRIRVPTLFS